MIVQFIDFLKQWPRTLRLLGLTALMAIVIWSLAAVDHSHAHTWAEQHIPGFWAVFAFLAAGILIFFAGWFGRSGIRTREDYYDR
jgi:4-hydroxybenzoate polyprenyltransferase